MKIKKSLFRKRHAHESVLRYLLLKLHLWLGLVIGAMIVVICLSGALYTFKDDVEDLAIRKYMVRKTEAKHEASLNMIGENFFAVYGTDASSFYIPKHLNRNIKVSAGGHGAKAIVAIADRQSGEIIGESNPKVSSFFMTVFKIHRWLAWDENRNAGRHIVAGTTCFFIFLLLSGFILWLPKKSGQKAWKHKFSLRLNHRFVVWNRDLHINLGAIFTIFLLFIAFTGICFTYPSLRNSTLNLFKTDQEKAQMADESHGQNRHQSGAQKGKEQASDKLQDHGSQKTEQQSREKRKDSAISKAIDYQQLITQTNRHLPYDSDINFAIGGRRSTDLTVRKMNIKHFLSPRVYDSVQFSESGAFKKVALFSDQSKYEKARSLLKSLHMGSLFGLTSKIFYFILALFAAYLPISGYIMWWKKVK